MKQNESGVKIMPLAGALYMDGKKIMDARSFAAGIQGIKNSTITWGKA